MNQLNFSGRPLLPVLFFMLCVSGLNPLAARADSVPVSALVQVQSLARQTLTPQIQTYGQVIADPTKTRSVTTQVGGQVTQLLVEPGQWVHRGQKLLILTLDPKASLAYQKAQSQWTVAKQVFRQKQYLYARQMATQQDVVQAKQAMIDAQKTVQALQKMGSNRAAHTLTAPEDALVLNIPVSIGSLVPPGGVLMALSSRHALLLRLGVEPEDAGRLQAGMKVTYHPVFGQSHRTEQSAAARIVRVNGQINPATRLLDVIARPENTAQQGASETPSPLIAGMTVTAQIDLPAQTGFVVPADAVLSRTHKGDYVYVVDTGHARQVPVQLGVTVGGQTVITPVKTNALHVGDSLVVVGQYPLRPGMAVRVQPNPQATGVAGVAQ